QPPLGAAPHGAAPHGAAPCGSTTCRAATCSTAGTRFGAGLVATWPCPRRGRTFSLECRVGLETNGIGPVGLGAETNLINAANRRIGPVEDLLHLEAP